MGKKLGIGMALIGLTFLLGLLGYIIIIFAGNDMIDDGKLNMDSATTLVDEDGQEVTKLFLENRELVSIGKIPNYVQQAFITVEDFRFYDHHGIDLRSIFRAIYKDILAGEKVEGGSTITQQLAKNIFLSNEKTWLRKTKEVVIAINLEKKYSKQKLLEMYLNQIYFGHGVYGIQSASKFYFNKDVSNLSLDEAAVIAAIPKSPTKFSPLLNPKACIVRRNLILQLMEKKSFITPNEMVTFQKKPLSLHIAQNEQHSEYRSYVDMVIKEAWEKFSLSNMDLLKGGYRITVPININVQQTAYQVFKEKRFFPGSEENVQGSFVLLDNKQGGVIACIGGRNYVPQGLNRISVKRQPGSTIKPLVVYGPALEETNLTPYSLLVDQKLTYGDYKPENFAKKYQTFISMYDALIHSTNAPAVWTLNAIGIDTGKKYLKRLGISIEDNGLAVALGGLKEGLSPLALAKSYRAFAMEGNVTDPYFITKIEDRNGNLIGQANHHEKQVFSKQTAWFMTKMLQSVVEEGTGRAGKYIGALAGKTGTTAHPYNEKFDKDAWFVGFTPNVVGALWMGYDKIDSAHYLTDGSGAATKLFKEIINRSNLEKPTTFQQPNGVKDLEKPIKLHPVKHLHASVLFDPLHFITVKLTWDTPEDARVPYHIYVREKGDDTFSFVGSVTGENNYIAQNVNILSMPSFYVAPYNSQTEQEGAASKIVKPVFFSQ